MIVVTGASGVLGTPLLKMLEASGQEVCVARSADLDLRDVEATTSFFADRRPSLVYHLAARVHGLGGNQLYPAAMFLDNIRINTNVIDAAARAGAGKIVAVSTVATYASGLPQPVQEEMIWNGPPHGSEQPYGHAKRAMLAQLEAYAGQFGVQFAYPIMTNLYGPYDRFDPVNGHVVPSLVPKFFSAANRREAVTVWGTGRAQRDFLFADDAARALIIVAEQVQGPINVATGRTRRIHDVVALLSAHSGVSDVRWDDSKPDGQLERSYDVSRLEALGFAPSIDLAEGLAQTYDWYAANYPNLRS